MDKWKGKKHKTDENKTNLDIIITLQNAIVVSTKNRCQKRKEDKQVDHDDSAKSEN